MISVLVLFGEVFYFISLCAKANSIDLRLWISMGPLTPLEYTDFTWIKAWDYKDLCDFKGQPRL